MASNMNISGSDSEVEEVQAPGHISRQEEEENETRPLTRESTRFVR